mgnify:FL=1
MLPADVPGFQLAKSGGFDLFIWADDDTYLAENILTGPVGENGRATGRGFATALIRMAARKRLDKRALVLGAGPVGCAGAETLALAGYEVFLCDMDGEKARVACGALSGCTPCTPDDLSGLPLFECLLDAAPTNDFFPLDRLAAGACISAPCVPCIWTLRAPEGASVWHDPLQLGTAVMLLAAAFGRP